MGFTPIQEAANEGHFGIVRLLTDRGAKLDIQDEARPLPQSCPHSNVFTDI